MNRRSAPARRRRAPASRPTTARTGARPSRTVRTADAAASAAATGSSGSVSAAASSGSESWSAIVGDGTPSPPAARACTRQRPPPRAPDGAPADRLAVTSAPPSTSRPRPRPRRQETRLVPRPPRPDDLYRLRIPTEPATVAGRPLGGRDPADRGAPFDGYRTSLWIVPTDGSAPPRQLTLGQRNDRSPRFSPDGTRWPSSRIAGRSSRRSRRAHDRQERPRGPRAGARPAARRTGRGAPRHRPAARCPILRMVARRDAAGRRHELGRGDRRRRSAAARQATATTPGTPPPSDYRFIDRLNYMLNGAGFTYDQVTHLWLVDVASGAATRLTDGPVADDEPAWSPDGTRDRVRRQSTPRRRPRQSPGHPRGRRRDPQG